MSTALLIGGPCELAGRPYTLTDHDELRGDKLVVVMSERLSPIPSYGFRGRELQQVERVVATYVRCEAVEGVWVYQGYEPTPEDEETVKNWLAIVRR